MDSHPPCSLPHTKKNRAHRFKKGKEVFLCTGTRSSRRNLRSVLVLELDASNLQKEYPNDEVLLASASVVCPGSQRPHSILEPGAKRKESSGAKAKEPRFETAGGRGIIHWRSSQGQ